MCSFKCPYGSERKKNKIHEMSFVISGWSKICILPLIISCLWFICKIQNVTDFEFALLYCRLDLRSKKVGELFTLPSPLSMHKKGFIVYYDGKPEKYDSFFSQIDILVLEVSQPKTLTKYSKSLQIPDYRTNKTSPFVKAASWET